MLFLLVLRGMVKGEKESGNKKTNATTAALNLINAINHALNTPRRRDNGEVKN